ncbi:MAG: hypothetical protein Kow00109_11650 [Acidobacteriota bacterium]
MKVDGNNPLLRPDLISQQGQAAQQRPSREPVEERTASADRVELSVSSRQLEQLARRASEAPEVRAERIAQLKAQIEAGTYNIKAEEIAEAIITGNLLDRTV